MHSLYKYTLHHNTFWLSPQRYIYWEEQQTIIISDLHFGKTGHFRKAGIHVPSAMFKEDLQKLFAALQYHTPKEIIVVGDMFHSSENKEMNLFLKWRKDVCCHFHLVKGNHDILQKEWYASSGIELHAPLLQRDNFFFIHDIKDAAQLAAKEYFFRPYTSRHKNIRRW